MAGQVMTDEQFFFKLFLLIMICNICVISDSSEMFTRHHDTSAVDWEPGAGHTTRICVFMFSLHVRASSFNIIS